MPFGCTDSCIPIIIYSLSPYTLHLPTSINYDIILLFIINRVYTTAVEYNIMYNDGMSRVFHI